LKRRIALLLALGMLAATSSFAAGISVSATRGVNTSFLVECPKIELSSSQTIDGQETVSISAPEASVTFDKGAPELPMYSALVMLEPNTRPVFSVKSLESVVSDVELPIVPSRGHFTRNIDPATVPYEFGSVYGKDAWYPAEKDMVKIGKPFIFREIRGANLSVFPVQYNPVKKQIKVHTKIQVTVSYEKKNSPNTIRRSQSISSVFEPIYKSTFINYEQASSRLPKLKETGRLLIITADKFASAMKPFVAWKKKIGIKVDMVPLSKVGKTNTDIKAYIQAEYDKGGLTNILLVGDAQHIPTNKGVNERADSDPCYTKLAGDDHVPDAMISRISAEDEAGVAYQVAKIINYEAYPTQNKSWYTRLLGVGSAEGRPADYTYIDDIKKTLIAKGIMTDGFNAYDPGAKAQQVTDAVNEGVALINYLGHGSGTSWGTTRFSNRDMSSLKNGNMLPIIFDVACVNGRFVNFTGFGEAWMRAGNIDNPAGAVGYCGSTTNMAWIPPIHVQAEINKVFIADKAYKTFGGLFFNGIIKGLELYTANAKGQGVMMMEQWHMFGDSTMQVRFAPPATVKSTSKSVRSEDGVTVNIKVADEEGKPVENARVTVYTPGVENVRVSYSNVDGDVTVTMPAGTTEAYYTVVGAEVAPIVDAAVKL